MKIYPPYIKPTRICTERVVPEFLLEFFNEMFKNAKNKLKLDDFTFKQLFVNNSIKSQKPLITDDSLAVTTNLFSVSSTSTSIFCGFLQILILVFKLIKRM